MTLTPYVFEQFGGLNLTDDPDDVGGLGATDLNNVDLERTGRIRCRSGYSLVKGVVTVTTVGGLAALETTSGTRQFVIGYTNGGTKTYAGYASTGGAAVATTTATTSETVSAVQFGTPTTEYLYIANGADTVWRWTGAAFSQPAGMPIATHLAVTAGSNRLVTANLSGLTSRVLFSNAGAPETFTYDTAPTPDTGDYVDLAPGDGSGITGLASWQGLLFAFKERRFFVFTGEGTTVTGTPEFSYRFVDAYGALVPPVSGDEGVFFFDGRSIWVTTGGTPVRVSRVIDSFWQGTDQINNNRADTALLTNVRLFYSVGRLYVKVPKIGGGYLTLVYDPKIDQWTQYNLPIEWVATLRTSGSFQPYMHWTTVVSGVGNINKFDPTLTTDPSSTPIPWTWQSGWSDLGIPGRVKVTQESRLWGASKSGTAAITLRVANDRGPSDAPASPLLGTYPRILDGWQQADREGTLWQHYVAAAEFGAVTRIAHYVSFVKPAGVE